MSEHLRHQVAALSDIVNQLEKLMNQRYQSKNKEKREVPVILERTVTCKFNESQPGEHEEVPKKMFEPKYVRDGVPLDIFNILPTFDGQREQYKQWRSLVFNAMKPLWNQQTTMRYYEALLIIRNNKIIGQASNILDDSEFSFENIIEQLDTIYGENESQDKLCISTEEAQYVSTKEVQQKDSSIDPDNSNGHELIQTHLVDVSKHKNPLIATHESNSQSETKSSQQSKKIESQQLKRIHRVNNSKMILNLIDFWTSKIRCGNELSLTQLLRSIHIMQLFYTYFENFELMEKLIEHSIFKRKNCRNLFKYFRKKFIHFMKFSRSSILI